MSILDRIRPRKKNVSMIEAQAFVSTLQKMMRRVNHPSAINEIDPRQLFRMRWTIDDWQRAVDNAEDVYSQNLYDLAEIYNDIVDDYAVTSAMQQRNAKVINSKIMFVNQDGSENEAVKAFFLNVDGTQKPWFRRWLNIAMDSKYYGFSVGELGAFIDGQFRMVEGRPSCAKLPYENLLPMYRFIKKDAEAGAYQDNVISMDKGPFSRWLLPMGNANDLGLLNKATPYVIFKNIFGAWSQHAEIFGQPFREGRTDIFDPARVKEMRLMFEQMVGASYGIFHPDDEIQYIEASKTDAYNIYDRLIARCDHAITKIFLSQTGTTDEKAFVGSAETHERVMMDLVMSDRLDLSEYFEDVLLPRLRRLGALPIEQPFSLVWIVEEHLTLLEWATVFDTLSTHYKIPTEEIERRFDIEVEEKPEPEPPAFPEKTTPEKIVKEINENVKDYYKTLWHERLTK